jgi:RimJ/RimL family protein N-acetyltransferase
MGGPRELKEGMSNLFTGKLTQLVAYDPDRAGELLAKWYQDSEFTRFYDFPPVRPRNAKKTQQRFREQASNPNAIQFHIETLASPQIIGECDLEMNHINHREAFVAIGIGEREYWGKGYGSDAMQILLRFGFQEWNLHRIALSAFDYNPRAIRSYEKVGFKHEGQIRGHLKRGGTRHNSVNLGILRTEWEALAGQ